MKQDLAPAERRLTAFDYVLYAALVLSWSASWYALSLQVGTAAVQTSLFWRFAIASSIMWAWVCIKREPMGFPLKLHLAFSGMGLFIFCLNFTFFYYGSVYLISGLLSVVFSLASVFNLALGFLIARRVPRGRVLAGALIGISGIALMFWPEISGQSWTGNAAFGLALCVVGTLSFCTGSQISASLQQRKISVLAASAWGMTYGAGFSAAMSLALGNSLSLEYSFIYLSSLIFLAIVSSVIAFWAYMTLIGRIGSGRSGYATVMFPVFALLISAVFEGYTFPAIAVAGLALVLLGNILVLGGGKPA